MATPANITFGFFENELIRVWCSSNIFTRHFGGRQGGVLFERYDSGLHSSCRSQDDQTHPRKPPAKTGQNSHFLENFTFEDLALFCGFATRAKLLFCLIFFTFVPRSEIRDLKNPHENGGKVRVDTRLRLADQQLRILLKRAILRAMRTGH